MILDFPWVSELQKELYHAHYTALIWLFYSGWIAHFSLFPHSNKEFHYKLAAFTMHPGKNPACKQAGFL